MISLWRWSRTPAAERTTRAHRGHGLCSVCYAISVAPPSTVTRRADLVEDIADVLEHAPTTTLAGLALRLGRSRDSITLALRRAARDGDPRAIAIRTHLHDQLRKDIAA